MPRISEFRGIVITMYWSEHGRPHFHAEYGGSKAVFAIEACELIEGKLPKPQLRLVREWAREHESQLHANWIRARNDEPLEPIAPTEMSEQFELVDVVDVIPLEGLWIRVTFDDGAVMDLGLEGVFGDNPGVFKRVVEDRDFFEQVRVDPAKGVVEWPGELDLDSEAMYGKVKPIGPDYQRRLVKPAAPSAA